MSVCLQARTAVIALKYPRKKPRVCSIVFPARWSKSALLEYVHEEHPNETVRILEWRSSVESDGWTPSLWLANPRGFVNYARGVR